MNPARVSFLLGFLVAIDLCAASSASGQTVTLDFTPVAPPAFPYYTRPPWAEDGFTLSQITPDARGTGAIIETEADRVPDRTPTVELTYSGWLCLLADQPGHRASVIITNDLAMPFDLVSLDLKRFWPTFFSQGAAEARVHSSAGGSIDFQLFQLPSTVTFTGAAWQNLSYVQVDLHSLSGSSQLLLDNFVLQVSAVPEPTGLAIMLLGIAGGAGTRLKLKKA